MCSLSSSFPLIDADAHIPLFTRLALSPEQSDKYRQQTRRYFHTRPRPHALYQHAFTDASVVGHLEHFRKGNIAFRGDAMHRAPDCVLFHEQLQRNTRPFVFRLHDERLERVAPSMMSSSLPPLEQALSTPFATFRGTLERR